MKILKNILLLAGLLLLTFCSKKEAQSETKSDPNQAPLGKPAPAQSAGFAGTVVETMAGGGYTYVHLDLGQSKVWLAGPETELKKGDKIQTPSKGSEMNNFNSKTLERTFESIFFVDAIQKGGLSTETISKAHGNMANKAATTPQDISFDNIKPLKGGINLTDLLAQKKELAGKEVSFRGKVVKANMNIMGTNWYHIQDGTGKPNPNDLTITSSAQAEVGNTVVVKGNLTLNKDFGQGYSYEVLIEKANITVE